MKSKTYVNGTKYILDAEFNNGSIVTLISHGNIYGKVKGDESEWETMLNRLTEIPEWAKPYIASQFQPPVHNEAGEVYVWVKASEILPKERVCVRYTVDGKMKYFDSDDWYTLDGLDVEWLCKYTTTR